MSASLRSTSLRLIALCGLIIAFGASGCSLFKRGEGDAVAPPDYARGEATAEADLTKFASADPWGQAFANGITAASDPRPAGAALADPAARVLVARAESRLEALRKLGAAILETKDSAGSPASQAIAGNAEARSRLTQMLEEQAIIVYAEGPDGITASAKLGADQLRAFFSPGSTPGLPILTDAQKEEANLAAYDKALAKAKQQLKIDLLALKTKGDQTVGDALAKDASAMNDLDARLFITQPDEVTYPVVGTCKVVIFFDKNRALELARRSSPWWKFWA